MRHAEKQHIRACGSGHFVVAATRKIAAALATVRTGDTEPTPADVRAATAEVIERCVYGVDLNDFAIEITKVALWLETFHAGRARCRSSTPTSASATHCWARHRRCCATQSPTPPSLRSATTTKSWTAKLKARNRAEREANADQLALEYGPETLNVETAQFTKVARDADAGTASTVRMRARADARCAAFVQPKKKAPGPGCATSG
jgi:hypothetical protein